MIICFLAPANNYHTIKWCNYFSSKGYIVHVISLVPGEIDNVQVHYINSNADAASSDFKKILYLFAYRKIRKIVETIKPNIISVHYASSYGFLAALSGIKNYTLSVWGSDIYDFPRKSIIHKNIVRYALMKATQIFSTSKAMAIETSKYSNKDIKITPFGVDCDLFSPNKRIREKDDGKFIVGTVKTLSPKYGIETLLKAISIVKKSQKIPNLELRIAGKGSHERQYKELAKTLGISEITTWLGFISQEEAAYEWANMDCAIIPSESESFGVSAVEAQASGIPIIISDIPGLMEATKPGITSIIIKRKCAEEIAEKTIMLYHNPKMREAIGFKGRENVKDNYELKKCFERINNLLIKKDELK